MNVVVKIDCENSFIRMDSAILTGVLSFSGAESVVFLSLKFLFLKGQLTSFVVLGEGGGGAREWMT